MNEHKDIEVDGKTITPVAIRMYQELVHVELYNDELTSVFPSKPNTPRYALRQNDVALGYFKVLSAKRLANNTTTRLTLHRQ